MQRQRSLIAEARGQRPAGLGQIGHRPSSAPDREAVADHETEFIGAIDCGTTSCRFYIFDQWADVVAHHQIEFEQLHPEPGWHEHDPSIYCAEIDKCIEACLEQFEGKGHSKDQLKGVGIATQRETTLLWDRQTGEPLYNAVAWPDARNASNIRDIRARAESTKFDTPDGVIVGEEGIRRLTGLPLSCVPTLPPETQSSLLMGAWPADRTYFSATKWDWLKENVEEVKEARKRGTLMAGTVDTWLVYQFTGGKDGGIHITDASNACRTLLFNLHKQSWCQQLCDFFDFPPEALPEVVSNSEVYGVFRKGHLLEGVPIAGLIGDQQAALVGNKCLTKGDAKQTYGTGCFMLYNTGTDIVKSTHGLVTTVAYKMGKEGPLHYALEGSIAVGGSSVTWLRDNLGIIDHPREAGELADEVPDTGGVYFVTVRSHSLPHSNIDVRNEELMVEMGFAQGFGGLFAPYWDIRATGMLIGLSTFTTKHHIVRATLEATCFQTRAILDAMSKDTALATSSSSAPNGTSEEKKKEAEEKGPAGLKVLQVDGGMTGSDVTMQLQADILGIDVRRPTMRESTVLGAALLAGGALGLFGWDLSRPETLQKVNRLKVSTFSPRITEEEKEWKYAGWVRAVDRARGWKTNSGHG
ncbi:Glycerol kinase [Rhodotorula toruloides]|nr:Glycerol kinase [Rhodotorula toruloides]